MSGIDQAPAVIDALKEQARELLSSALGTNTLVAFNIGALGNFPYTWSDPSNLKFNAKTYGWIKSALKAGASPATQDEVFTNEYINALASVSYGYSEADIAALNTARENAEQQQGAMLSGWQAAGFHMPSGDQPINDILTKIQTEWASPPTTLFEIKNAHNLNRLLNNTPAAGQTILPLLANYLQALGSAVSLLNQSTMNTGYLSAALEAVQDPSETNGGIVLNDGSPTAPAYTVSTSQADILNGLKHAANKVALEMSVSSASSSEFKVNVHGGAGFNIPFLDFFGLGIGGSASYFSDHIVTSSNKVDVTMEFTGVTLVSYGPAKYDASLARNWYWMTPIRDAIANGKSDVTGFRFAPDPGIDFSASGPFGLTTNAAISNYPSVTIVVTSSDYESIQKTFEQHTHSTLSFLGIPLASASESTYSNSVQVDASSKTVTITLTPPPGLIANPGVDAVGWVLGAVTDYPAA